MATPKIHSFCTSYYMPSSKDEMRTVFEDTIYENKNSFSSCIYLVEPHRPCFLTACSNELKTEHEGVGQQRAGLPSRHAGSAYPRATQRQPTESPCNAKTSGPPSKGKKRARVLCRTQRGIETGF